MDRRLGITALLVVALALGVLAVGGRVAQGATDLVAAATSSTTAPSTTEGAGDDDGSTTTTDDVAPTTTVVDENDDGVARVVIVGDSLVVGVQPALTERFEANGVEHRFIAVSGTGLLTDQGVRLAELRAAVEELHPDVVLIESCCNYDGAYTLADGTVVAADSDLLWEVWAAQLDAMIAVAEEHDAAVTLVVTPRLVGQSASASLALRIERFNEIYRATGETLIDWDEVLYPGGTTTGRASVRASDGLHLSATGNELVAEATWAALAGSFS